MGTWGRIAMMDARANTDAEPETVVNHQMRANWTSLLPNREKACPVNITQKLLMVPDFSTGLVISKVAESFGIQFNSLS
jgi:hypothetical protein